jgi:NAD(P)H dehydrogenase (quinone)
MSAPKILVAFYSTYGTNHAVAEAAAEAARAAGAEVRLVRFAETAPAEVVAGQDAWKAQADKVAGIPVISHDDMEWADGYFWSVPTRYGSVASQARAFIDTLGPLWMAGKLADKTFTATTSAQNVHGGQETTLIGLYTSGDALGRDHRGAGLYRPRPLRGRRQPLRHLGERGRFGEEAQAAVAHQAKRLVEFTAKIAG